MPDELEQQPPTAEVVGHGDTLQLKDIQDEFETLSMDIKVCHSNILGLLRGTTQIIDRTIFSVLTPEQDEDLFEELAHVNELLGKARIMHNAFITVENSIPNFGILFDYLHDIEQKLDDHQKSVFFQVQLRDNGKCLYPKAPVEQMVKMFGTMLGGTRGTAQGAGKFIKYSQLLEGAGNSGDGHNNEQLSYRSGRSRTGVTEFEEQQENPLGM